MSDTKECLFCVNIPLGEVMIYTFDLFDDQETAKFIAIESGKLLKKAWLRDRFSMCGKSRIGFLCGAIYITALISNNRITQRTIAQVFEKNKVMVRTAYNRLLKILPEYAYIQDGLYKHDRIHLIQCVKCKNAPNIEDFKIDVKEDYWRKGEHHIRITAQCMHNKYVEIRLNNVSSCRKCDYFERREDFKNLRDQIKLTYNNISLKITTEIARRGF